MKSKLIALVLLAGGSAFAQTRFSFSIGTGGPGYYAPPPVYYAPARPYFYRHDREWGGAGYWGEDFHRRHERAEWYRRQKQQWYERNREYVDGRAYGSARDGLYQGYRR